MPARRWLRATLSVVALTLAIQLLLSACSSSPDDIDKTPVDSTPADSTSAATTTTVLAGSPPPPPGELQSLPDPGLTADELLQFTAGEVFFHEVWTEVGPQESGNDGLGPLFNADSCAACHAADGTRFFPPQGAVTGEGLIVRISIPGIDEVGAPLPQPEYGDQLQDRANSGIDAEGVAWTDYVVQTGFYGDGTPFEILWPTVTVRDRNYGTLGDGVRLSARNGALLVGMGLIEAIPEEAIVAGADPNDANGDGISGRVNIVWEPVSGEQVVGRFGWKSNIATLEHQVAQAFSGDLGVTSRLVPDENCTEAQPACTVVPNGGSAEVDAVRSEAILAYLRGLAVPEPRTSDSDDAQAGQEHFQDFGCTSCHTETFQTGTSPIGALSNRTIQPYTDLLLHDMGFDMGDDRPDFLANGNEWRTPPLWGLGLTPVVDGSLGLLHDGRARTLEEAILWHGGEGRISRQQFIDANLDTREELLAFLRSL